MFSLLTQFSAKEESQLNKDGLTVIDSGPGPVGFRLFRTDLGLKIGVPFGNWGQCSGQVWASSGPILG